MIMSKFRKLPVEIQAWLISDLRNEAYCFQGKLPSPVKAAVERGEIIFADNHVIVKTLEGDHRGELDDMLIQGVKGEFYPCKPDIFERTYERVL
jgi:hypothetical protein